MGGVALGAGGGLGFLEDVIEVEFDGALGDAEAVGDFFVGEAFGDEGEDLMFAGGEGVGLAFGWCGDGFEFLSFVEGLLDEAAEGGDDDTSLEIVYREGAFVGGELFAHVLQGVEEASEVEVGSFLCHVFTLHDFRVMWGILFLPQIGEGEAVGRRFFVKAILFEV